jgi:Na+/H+ antiporter NhaC
MMGGLIGIIYRNGGAYGIADRISVLASNRRRGQISTSSLGFAIFFSTYANSLVIGNTMRPVTDRLKISREKLAYIVDSTAAPLAAIAVISTWIGFEVGLIQSSVASTGFEEGAYSIFLKSIPYNFYPILALFFVLAVGATGRDFGPMYAAERRAQTEGKVLRDDADVDANADEEGGDLRTKEDAPRRAYNAIIPIGVLVGTVAVGLYVTGEGETLRDIIGSADTGKALLWSGLLGVLGVLVAAVMSVGQRILTLKETVDAWYGGLKSVLFVMIILTLAWALGSVAEDLKTANYLVSVLGDALPPQLLPALLFMLAAAVSFAVGTSWGTMGILMPLAVPLIWTVLQNNDMATPENYYIMYATIGTVLAGSVWGDHCSPISDTTIISSVAAGSDHIDHVRTQIPYALTVGFVALFVGLVPTGFGAPWWITLPAGAAVLVGVLLIFGKKADARKIDAQEHPEQREEAAGTSSE